jgi:hypothetical protein
VTLVTIPSAASASVDGKAIGLTPIDAHIPCSGARVAIERVRYEHQERMVLGNPEHPTREDFRLVRPEATLELVSIPPGARFTVQGTAAAGRARVASFTAYEITATLAGFRPWRSKVYVKGSGQRVTARLDPLATGGQRPRRR